LDPGSKDGQMAETKPDPHSDSTNHPKSESLGHRALAATSRSLLTNAGVEGERAARVEQKLQLPLMIAAALTLPSVILMETTETGTLQTVSTILNWGTWLVFALDVVLMLILVPNRWHYIKNHPVEILIVILTPPVLPGSFQILRMLRLLRLLRLLKLAQFSRRAFSTEGLAYAALMTVTVAIIGGSLFRAFEAKNQDLSEWEGIYWAITTMMTLGSQYESTTTATEVIELFILVAGVGFISILTGALAQKFVAPPKEPEPGAAKATGSGSGGTS
jgi:voltage-gated potassium channel